MTVEAGKRSSLAPLPLRLVLGCGLMIHGAPKLFSSSGQAMIRGLLEDLEIPAPWLMAWVVGSVEFFGGLAILLGVFVSFAALLNVANMVVAMVKVHLPAGFSFLNITGRTEDGLLQFGLPGYEVNLLYIAGLLALVIGGSGALSMGRYMTKTKTVIVSQAPPARPQAAEQEVGRWRR
ncbi:MAG: DoxX family protein [Bryobacterales bacterium]|nr:DoxX family protein [Bryobacterales bacterium]